MNSKWQTILLGDLCHLTKGASPTQKTTPGDYPLVVTGPVPLSSADFQFDGEAVCIPMVSSTGHGHASLKRIHFASGKFAVANIITAAEVKELDLCVTKFLYLYLQHFKDDLIVPRMQGTANVSLSQKALRTVPVSLPPLDVQQRILDLIGALDNAVETAASSAERLRDVKKAAILALTQGSDFESVRLGDVMTLDLQTAELQSGKEYPLAGVLNRGRGLLLRNPITKETTSYTKLTMIRPLQVVYSKLKAFEGSITVAPADLDERYASGEFPTFTCSDRLFPEYFRLLTLKEDFWTSLKTLSRGMGGRRERVAPRDFLTLGASLPAPERQKEIVETVIGIELTTDAAERHEHSLRTLRRELLSVLLSGEYEIPESYDQLLEVVAA